MHIPSAPTAELALLPFDEALARSGKSGGYDPAKWLYVPDFYTEYRYILGTRGKRPLICIGINPSTAEPDNLDNTLKSVQRIADGNGFDSFIMFNVYAQRATRPQDMEKARNEALHRENMAAFAYILEHCEGTPAVWAAWGNIIEMRGYLKDCVLDMIDIGQRFGAVWYTAGKHSVKGHPHHPLYLRKDSGLDPFDVRSYCENCL
ncbi:MAG: DUF1643 domain-containing protein [Oscillospiraceae bacterium]